MTVATGHPDTRQRSFDIFKITDALDQTEQELGVIAAPPVWSQNIALTRYFELMLDRLTQGEELLSPPEVGCTLAHLSVYEKIIGSGRPAVILEQDISLRRADLDRLDALLTDRRTVEFMHLAEYQGWPFFGTATDGKSYKVDYLVGFWGAAAYYVTPDVARRLVDFHADMFHRADDWRCFFKNSDITPYYAPVFYHAGEVSSIHSERRLLRPVALKKLIKRRISERIDKLRYAWHIRWRARDRLPSTDDQRGK